MTSDNPDGGAAVAARIRRLSAGGAGTMTPAEILNSILTSVGVGTATGGPLRRRSTSSPEAGNSNSLSTASEDAVEGAEQSDADSDNSGVPMRLALQIFTGSENLHGLQSCSNIN